MACRPKKTASAQAVRLRVMRSGACRVAAPGAGSCGGAAGVPRSRTSGSQGRTAVPARAAHTARPDCQPPPRASVRGTVTAAAREVPRARAIEYRPVMEPTRSGNQRLTMTGMSTLLTAMPIRASALAARNPAVLPR